MKKLAIDLYGEAFLKELFRLERLNMLPQTPPFYPPLLSWDIYNHKKDIKRVIRYWENNLKRAENKEIGLYIHIPFCKQICKFCGFYKKLLKDNEEKKLYIETLINEISFYSRLIKDNSFKWLYIGGGTPTILEESEIDKLFKSLHGSFNLLNTEAMVVEATPDTLTLDKLRKLKEHKVNYIGIGIQSFNEDLMKKYGRDQTKRECLKAIENVRKAGINNIGLHFILGLEGQTKEMFINDIKTVCNLDVQKIYLFDYQPRFLTKENNYDASLLPKKLEEIREWKREAIDLLSKSGYTVNCGNVVIKKNSTPCPVSYDINGETAILALGASGIGYCQNGFKYRNKTNPKEYVESLLYKNELPIGEIYFLTKKAEMINYILLSLINYGDLNAINFENIFKTKIEDIFFIEFKKLQKIGIIVKSKDRYILTNRVQGIFFIQAVFYENSVIKKLAKRFNLRIEKKLESKLSIKSHNLFINFNNFTDKITIAKEIRERYINGEKISIFYGKGKDYISNIQFITNLSQKIGYHKTLVITELEDIISFDRILSSNSNSNLEIFINIKEKELKNFMKLNKFSLLKNYIPIIQISKNKFSLSDVVRYLKTTFNSIIFYYSISPTPHKVVPPTSYSKIKHLFKEAYDLEKKFKIKLYFLDIPQCILNPYDNMCYFFIPKGDLRESDISNTKISECRYCKYVLQCKGLSPDYLKKYGYTEIRTLI